MNNIVDLLRRENEKLRKENNDLKSQVGNLKKRNLHLHNIITDICSYMADNSESCPFGCEGCMDVEEGQRTECSKYMKKFIMENGIKLISNKEF